MSANTIQFTTTPGKAVFQVSAANTNRDGTGTIVTLIAGTASGRYVRKIRIKATGTTTAGMVAIYFFDGTNIRLEREIAVTAITPSTSVTSFETEVLFSDLDAPILIGTSTNLQASTQKAETFNIHIDYADY